MASHVSLVGEGVSIVTGSVSLPGTGVSLDGPMTVAGVGVALGGADIAPALLFIGSIPATGSVSSTINASGTYVSYAPHSLVAVWNPGAIASTVTLFTASVGNWSATFTTPSVAGSYRLTITGTGANLASATSAAVVMS